jgi:hypothetical protein
MKSIILAGAVALLSIGPVAAQSPTTDRLPAASTAPANLAAAEACEGQMRRLAGLNKTFGANYNAEHDHEVCLGEL